MTDVEKKRTKSAILETYFVLEKKNKEKNNESKKQWVSKVTYNFISKYKFKKKV